MINGEASVDSVEALEGNLLVTDDDIASSRSDGAVNLYAHLDSAILGKGLPALQKKYKKSIKKNKKKSKSYAPANKKFFKKTKSSSVTKKKKTKSSPSSKKKKIKYSKKNKTTKTSSTPQATTTTSTTTTTKKLTSLPPKVAAVAKLSPRRWNILKNIFSISMLGGPAFHPFKNEMIFVSSASGVYQLYKVGINRKKGKITGKPIRLVHTKSRCSAPRYLHDGSILYYHDRGGNENFQIGLITPKGKHIWLTEDLKAKHLINRVTKNYLYYQSNSRNKKFFDLYRRPMPLVNKDGSLIKAERLYTPEVGIPRVTLVSSDETQLVIEQKYSNIHNELFLKDLVDGTLTPLTKSLVPGMAKVRWSPLRFLNRGHTKMLISTDYKSDFKRLAILDFEGDIKSNPAKFIALKEMETLKHDIVGVMGNSRTKWTYIELNQDGYSKLYKAKLGPQGFKTPLIPVPLPLENGVIVHGDARSFGHSSSITHDGNLMAITMTDSVRPVNIFMLDLDPYNVRFNKKAKEVKKLQEQQKEKKENDPTTSTLVTKEKFKHIAMYWTLLNDRLPGALKDYENKFSTEKLISVSSFDGLMIPFFVYSPVGDEPEGGWPAIIKLHGGPESQSRPVFSPLIQFLTLSGYAVVVPNVRGSKGYGRKYLDADNVEKRMHAVKDVAAIATFLQRYKGINGNKLFLGGGSYGGYLTNLCMTQIPQYFKGGISIVGMTNLLTFYKNTAEFRRRQRYEEYGNYHTQKDFLKSISPVTYIDNVVAPMFIIQGKNDERVPAEEAENWYNKLLQESKKPGKSQLKHSKLELFADEGHGFSNRNNRLKAYHDLVDWLNLILNEQPEAPKPAASTVSK